MFYDLVGAHSNPELLKIESEVALKQARHWNPISMDAALFGRVTAAGLLLNLAAIPLMTIVQAASLITLAVWPVQSAQLKTIDSA